MDRPAGPRQPDKRNVAYESIFGRPSVIHHQPSRPGPLNGSPYASSSSSLHHYPQTHQLQPQHIHQPPLQQQHYPQYAPQQPQHLGYSVQPMDRRTSMQPNPYIMQHSPYPISQAYLPYQSSQNLPYHQASLPPSVNHSRTRSVVSTPSAASMSSPPTPPSEVTDSTHPGLTEAQAYQAQIASSSPMLADGGTGAPILGAIESDDGRLGLDFQSKVTIDATVFNDSPFDPSPGSRRSSESAQTLPTAHFKRDPRGAQDRSMSMSAASMVGAPNIISGSIRRNSRPPIPGSTANLSKRAPIVYPALLSRVAEAFYARITLADRLKDGLTYKDAFDGREAVDKIAFIIKTTDRNLALLLGRALDAQKFFHDVTYDHRLRDNSNELYQFQTTMTSPFTGGEGGKNDEIRPKLQMNDSSGTENDDGFSLTSTAIGSPVSQAPSVGLPLTSETMNAGGIAHTEAEESEELSLPSGVFTLLTDCYSPTCSRDHLCYSIACPRRLEQQARLNMKPEPGLKKLQKSSSKESLLGDIGEPGTLWIHSAPQEIVNSVSDQEKRRQEAINEIMYTERDFVRDMEYLRDVWIGNIKDGDFIQPPARRTDFLEQVFWNIHDIIAVSSKLRESLNKRQKSHVIVERVGDIFLDAAPYFGPFVTYGSHQLYGKYEFEKEKASNPAFAAFVETTERLPESRKLELNGYLTKPTTRLARYPLLLGAVLKHTRPDNPDFETLPQVITLIREFLNKVNIESGRTENRFNLLQLDTQLSFKPGEAVDLRLTDDGRELIYKGALNKRGGTQVDTGDLQVFLFDHALVMTKPKNKADQYKVYRRPIPLELLLVSAPDDLAVSTAARPGNRAVAKRPTRSYDRAPNPPNIPFKIEGKGYPIHFVHLGRKFYQITLWASTLQGQKKWIEHISTQQELMREQSIACETIPISENFFISLNKVNCAAPYNGGRRILYGTDDGVYLQDLRGPNQIPIKVLSLVDCSQIDILEDYQLLIVLSERQVMTFPLEAFDSKDPLAGLKRAKKISSHTSFFKAGICLGKVLVCVVKSSPLSSTIKVLEPIDQNIRGRSKPTFRKILQGGNDTLKLFREFYIPVESSSIHFLKTKLCVGCSKGFDIIDLESLDTQGLLDPTDLSLDFVKRRENSRPVAIYRIENEFLLCYDEFAFFVDKRGWRSRKDFMVYWEGTPTGFAIHYPYILAFEPTFVEIRHVETGFMAQVIQGNNLRLIFADSPPSATHGSVIPAQQPNPYQNNLYEAWGAMSSTASFGRQGPYASPGYVQPLPQQMNYTNPYMRTPNAQAFSRDEIIMCSDDRVFTVRFPGVSHSVTSDSASMMSIPR